MHADTRRAPRLRRLTLAAVAAAALAGGVALGAQDDPPPERPGAVGPSAAATRAQLDAAIGQRLVTAFPGTTPDALTLGLARQGRIGGVILFAPNIRSVGQVRAAVTRLQRAAHAGGRPPLLVMVDQEGGPVKRFASLPPRRAPRAMRTSAVARSEGRATARALRRAGVHVDLAPVADITKDRDSFLYERAFRSPALVCAFAAGLRSGGVLPALKHFPGLGGAPQNTDDVAVTLPASRATLVAQATAYRRCGASGLVMVASAAYRALGPGPALLRAETYALLRSVQPRAVTISDALQARALAGRPHVPVRALRAGVDLLLSTGSPRAARDIFLSLAGASRRHELGARTVLAGAARVAALKRRYFR